MAQPITLDVPVRDPRIALQARLQNAPIRHAEALLDGYEVLQALHDAGALDLLRGALGSKDKVLDAAVESAGTPSSVRGIRNLMLLINMLGTIEPDVLKTFTQATPTAFKTMLYKPARPGLWALIKDFLWNQDFRYGMAALNSLLEVLGKNLCAHRKQHPLSR